MTPWNWTTTHNFYSQAIENDGLEKKFPSQHAFFFPKDLAKGVS